MDFTKNLEKSMEFISTKGAFLTGKDGDKVNTMTIAWGFIGFLWNKPYFIAVVRPQRYTNSLLKNSDSFSISVPFGTMAEELRECGTKSGANVNKAEIVNFMDAKSISSPVVDGCDMYYECKTQYRTSFEEAGLPEAIVKTLYKDDYHHIYYGEIVDCYSK